MVQYTGQVFDVLRNGATETTDLGDTVTLAARAGARPDRAGLHAAGALEPGIDELECPDTIECEAIEALYVQTDPDDPGAYVNYDLADREHDVSIDYLVVHDTECDYDDCVRYIDHDEVVVPSTGRYVTPKADTPVTVYARAYPEEQAYAGTPVPYQGQPTFDTITLKPGQEYVLADRTVPTDYYRATSSYNQLPGDGTVIRGQVEYYQVWVGHRFGYVKKPDVDVLRSGRR